MKPKVSICIPNYNYEKYICEALESALNQSYTNIEVIVSDNCSTDNSLDAISKYKDKIKIYKNKTNVGIADNHNIAASYANGDFFVLLSSDDVLKPDFISKTMEIFLQFENSKDYDIGMVISEKDIIDENGNVSDFAPFYASDFVCKGESHAKVSMMGNPTPPSFCLIKKSAFLKTKGFQKIYGTAHDWGFMFDINMVSDFGYVHEKLGLYRVHSGISTKSVENFRYISNIHNLKLDIAERVKDNEYLSNFIEASIKKTSSQCLKWGLETLKAGKFDIAGKYMKLAVVFDESMAENPVNKAICTALSTKNPIEEIKKLEQSILAVNPRTEPYEFPRNAERL